jgi:hypothetical protein
VCGRLSLCNALLERLAEPLDDLTPALRAFVQAAHAMVRPRPLTRPRELTAAPAHSRDGVMRGAEGPRHDQRYAGAGETGDAEVTPVLSEGQRVSSRPTLLVKSTTREKRSCR